jgi:hypothetical protein
VSGVRARPLLGLTMDEHRDGRIHYAEDSLMAGRVVDMVEDW